MNRQEIVRQILSECEEQRRRDRSGLEERLADACARDAAIGELRDESAQLAFDTMRGIMSGAGDARSAAEAMKRRGQEINREIRDRLSALGLPENYLEEQYRCPLCRDTGYVGEAPARLCRCVEAEARRRALKELEESGFSCQRFEDFDPEIIPEENGQRRQMIAVREACMVYIGQYPDYPYRNLLLTGEGGLGKTYLLNCVYARALEKGIGALRVTGFRMLEAMRRKHMGAGAEDERDFAAMVDAPLLFIDDLGTEPMLRNITVEYLFALLNERMAAGRHTVIATNLSPVNLKEHYGERVASRLLDKSCAVIHLKGKDLRRV